MSEQKLKTIGVRLLVAVSFAVSATVFGLGAAHARYDAARPQLPRPAPVTARTVQTDVIIWPGGPFDPYQPTPPRGVAPVQGAPGDNATWPPMDVAWPPDGDSGSNPAPQAPIVMPSTQPAQPRP